ncbi:Spore germination protein B1 [compost metagenome]|jgi:spore germination protein KA|uniref:spore germination protein n=1 Tax=Paenibacillus TaxID=44249 RepID=UPI000FABE56A|nr:MULTISPECIES: spore germination protein [Paenibacillus]MUG88465.1 spore germination protein [Paenibacillus timonensis]GIP46459.1 spore germination protein KA [Paenibacillus sp. J53TS2]
MRRINRNRPPHIRRKDKAESITEGPNEAASRPIDGPPSDTVVMIQEALGNSPDVHIRKMANEKFVVSYIDSLTDPKLLSELMSNLEDMIQEGGEASSKEQFADSISAGSVKLASTEREMLSGMLTGAAAVLVEGVEGALLVSIPGGSRRSVEEPSSQTVIRGPKEGFTEDISTNLSLIRKRLRTPDLRLENRVIGTYTQTRVVVAYIRGIAQASVVEEVLKRLDAIDTDSILESGYIEEFIQDRAFTPFPTIINTERPDTVAGSILDGQVSILIDGTPFALVCPVTFFKFFLSSEDYYQRYDISSFLRNIRLFSFLVAMLLPSLYIAVTTFHPEMLPTTMLISIAAQREGTPLPALLEAMLMEITFEVIREAGVRMPRVVGPAISIVGALVLGQAAVQAGLVSAVMVIIVSFTAIANFVIPTFAMSSAVRLIRFGLMILAGSFGLYGILSGIIPLLMHLVSLQSFGVPYFLPVAPLSWSNIKDVFIRLPWPRMNKRPEYISIQNQVRQGNGPKEDPNKS